LEISVDLSFIVLLLGLGGLLLGCSFGMAANVRPILHREDAVCLLPPKRPAAGRQRRRADALHWIRRKLPGRRSGRSGQDEPSPHLLCNLTKFTNKRRNLVYDFDFTTHYQCAPSGACRLA